MAPFDAILSGRYTGFNTIDIPVNGQSTLDINMKTSSSALGEIVVTGHGY